MLCCTGGPAKADNKCEAMAIRKGQRGYYLLLSTLRILYKEAGSLAEPLRVFLGKVPLLSDWMLPVLIPCCPGVLLPCTGDILGES